MNTGKRMSWKPVGLLALSIMLLLAACQSNSASNPPPESGTGSAPAANEKKPVEISYWYPYGDATGKAQEALVKKFNESQNEVVVKAYYQSNYVDLQSKLQAALVAKNAPEVAIIENAAVGAFASKGVLEDLGPWIEKDRVDLKNFIPGTLGNSYVNGKFYAFPQMASTLILYLNATMLKEAGLDPNGPQTWEEFEQYARALTIPGKRTGISMPLDHQYYEMFIQQAGGKLFASDGKSVGFNTPEGIAPLELWKRMAQEGVLDYPVGDNMQELSRQNFIQQKSGMYLFSTSRISYFTEEAKKAGFELKGALVPGQKNRSSMANGGDIVMLGGLSEEKKNAAWTFIKWMVDTDQASFFSSQTGYLPITYSAQNSDVMKAAAEQNPLFQVANSQMEHTVARPMIIEYPEISKLIVDAIQKVMIDKTATPEQVIRETADKANQVLQKK